MKRIVVLLALLLPGAVAADKILTLTSSGTRKATDSPTVAGTLTTSAARVLARRQVTSTPTTLAATDHVVGVNLAGAAAITLPSSPTTGRHLIVCDDSGAASSNNITITPTAGNIDGAANKVISTNYACVTLYYTSSEWRTAAISAASGTGTVTQIICGTGLTGGTITTSGTCAADFGTVSGKITQGNDTRLPPAPSAAGKLLYDTGSAYAALAAGTAGQQLISGGAGAPTWNANTAWISTSKLATSMGDGVDGNAGYALGSKYLVGAVGITADAIQCPWTAGGGTGTIVARIRNSSGTSVANCSITPSDATGAYSCNLASPYSMSANTYYYITCRHADHGYHWTSTQVPPARSLVGPSLTLVDFGCYRADDTDGSMTEGYANSLPADILYHLTP